MADPWWMDPETQKADPSIPIYTDETGWATLDQSSEMFSGDVVQLLLVPLERKTDYSSRIVRLSLDPSVPLDVRSKNDRKGALRLPSSLPILKLMLSMLTLTEPPLATGPFN